jgi:hypothetical protein
VSATSSSPDGQPQQQAAEPQAPAQRPDVKRAAHDDGDVRLVQEQLQMLQGIQAFKARFRHHLNNSSGSKGRVGG